MAEEIGLDGVNDLVDSWDSAQGLGREVGMVRSYLKVSEEVPHGVQGQVK